MYPSIFNDVFGPIMIGCSSSAFAGPARIGLIARDYFGGLPESFRVSYVPGSGRAALRVGLGTNMGLLAGLLGFGPEDKRVFTAFERAKELGLRADFVVEDIPNNDIRNAMLVKMADRSGECCSLLADSVGGGTIDILLLDDFPTRGINGEEYVLAVVHGAEDGFEGKVRNFLEQRLDFSPAHILRSDRIISRVDANRVLTLLFMEKAVSGFSALTHLEGVVKVRQLNPIMPIVTRKNTPPPLFTSLAEMIALAESEGVDCSQIVIRYEMERSGWSREDVVAYMERIWGIMKNTVAVGRDGRVKHSRGPFHPSYAPPFLNRLAHGTSLLSGVMADAVANSVCSHEGKSDDETLTVAGPAAGSPPIMTGALGAVARKNGLGDKDIVHALFTAAGIGAVTYMKTVPTGEITGCSGEVGVASAMAAGALVTLVGGSPARVDAAAAIALMNLFGLPCDPIAGGGCSMPCRGRSALAPVNAIMCAELALSGFDSVVPYDQVVTAMDTMYKELPGYMKGSLDGGLPISESAKSVETAYQKWLEIQR